MDGHIIGTCAHGSSFSHQHQLHPYHLIESFERKLITNASCFSIGHTRRIGMYMLMGCTCKLSAFKWKWGTSVVSFQISTTDKMPNSETVISKGEFEIDSSVYSIIGKNTKGSGFHSLNTRVVTSLNRLYILCIYLCIYAMDGKG